jgi:hypothetical protein
MLRQSHVWIRIYGHEEPGLYRIRIAHHPVVAAVSDGRGFWISICTATDGIVEAYSGQDTTICVSTSGERGFRGPTCPGM